ncbi:uncharacterized protein LOC127767762 isoform X3 [Oryza glaberrima]|uniref:uncharacterized protein LOC127767762 isoform X3 n=1 Tax=Oryza glaberrima TaxID=4538 RepID=UPI00224C3C2D|nr:uncharacterized protein LOC127767762 isoform X3 [Oryza glaberrima]
MVDTLVANQTSMMAQNERLEKQYEELKSMLLASQGHAPITRSPVPKSATKHQLEELDDVNYNNHAPSLSSRNKKTLPRSERFRSPQLELNKQTEPCSKVTPPCQRKKKLRSPPLELNKENMLPPTVIQRKSKKPTPSELNLQHRKRKFQTLLHEELEVGSKEETTLKCGMEVGITSPTSGKMVALGTIQKTDRNAISIDGKALNDCVDILVNAVFNQHTILPRANGMINILGNAQARCIPWPRENLIHPNGKALYSKVLTAVRHISSDQGDISAPRRQIHDLTYKENIGHEDVHSRTRSLGKASAGSLSAIKFSNSQVLTTSRF